MSPVRTPRSARSRPGPRTTTVPGGMDAMTVRRGLLYFGVFLVAAGGVTLLVSAGVLDEARVADALAWWPAGRHRDRRRPRAPPHPRRRAGRRRRGGRAGPDARRDVRRACPRSRRSRRRAPTPSPTAGRPSAGRARSARRPQVDDRAVVRRPRRDDGPGRRLVARRHRRPQPDRRACPNRPMRLVHLVQREPEPVGLERGSRRLGRDAPDRHAARPRRPTSTRAAGRSTWPARGSARSGST